MHSNRSDSFFPEDEHFFGTYEPEQVAARGSLMPFELEAVDAQPPTEEELAHFNRFRRPVAWVMGALASLSVAAFAAHGTRRELSTHSATMIARSTAAAVAKVPTLAAVRRSPAALSTVAPAAAEGWSWDELAESMLELVLEPAPPSTSSSKLPSLTDSAAHASLVEEFTSAVMSMCRNASSPRGSEARTVLDSPARGATGSRVEPPQPAQTQPNEG